MKRDRPLEQIKYDNQRLIKRFYEDKFKLVRETVLYGLATYGGRFNLWQREICPRQDVRNYMFYKSDQVFAAIKDMVEMGALQFGPVFPCTHYERPEPNPYHVLAQPVKPLRLDDGACVDRAKPRKFEREAFKPPARKGGGFEGGNGVAPSLAAYGGEGWSHTHTPHSAALTGGGMGPSGGPGALSAPFSEVVIDMDMDSDFHNRSKMCACGIARKVCDTCWAVFMDSALQVLNCILDFFEFKARFAVFSGRRGFHIWILDERCFFWNQQQRASFIDAIQRPVKGSALDRAVRAILNPLFEKYKHMLVVPEGIPPADQCMLLYPCLDRAVTADATHLHKLPLTIHTETLNLCSVINGTFIPSRDVVHVRNVTEQVMMANEKLIYAQLTKIKVKNT